MDSKHDSLLSVFSALFRWKRPILWVTGLAALVTGIVMLFLPNYYKSTTIFYAASPDQFKPEMIFGLTTTDMDFFGEDVDIDRLLSIGKSTELVTFMIDSFDLYKHYDIDSTTSKSHYKVREHFLDLYDVQKNKFDAIELSVEDKDPKMAALMCKVARAKIDAIASGLIKQSQNILIQTYQNSLTEKNKDMTALADTMRWLRNTYGIADPNEQGRLIAELLTQAESSLSRDKSMLSEYLKDPSTPKDTLNNIRARIRGAEGELKAMAGGGGSVDLQRFNKGRDQLKMIDDIHEEQSEQLGESREKLYNLQAVFGSTISSLHIVEEAEEPLRKSRPMRLLIIIAATLAAFVLSSLTASLLDSYRDVDFRRIMRGEDQ